MCCAEFRLLAVAKLSSNTHMSACPFRLLRKTSVRLQICQELIQASVSHPWAAEHQQARRFPTLSVPVLLHMLGVLMCMDLVMMCISWRGVSFRAHHSIIIPGLGLVFEAGR